MNMLFFSTAVAIIWDYLIYIILFAVIIAAIVLTFVLGDRFSNIRELNNMAEARERIIEGLQENFKVWEVDAIAFNYELARMKNDTKNKKVNLIKPIDIEEFRR